MRFGICNELYEPWSFADTCASIAKIGYTGVEIAPFTLAPLVTDLTATQRSEIRRIAADHGLEVIGLHWLLARTTGFHLNSADAAVRRKTAEYLGELARCCADLGGKVLVFGSPAARRIPDGVSREEAYRYAADTLSRLTGVLEDCDVTFCLEPLAPSETDFMQSAAEADQLRRMVGHPLVALHLDVKAMSAEDKPIPDVISEYLDRTRHFHANDPNLRGPGMGQVDFGPIFRALRQGNYQGWVSVEVFDFKPDPETIARESLQYMQRVASTSAAE